MRKTFFDGTHRTRHPAETWTTIQPLLPGFGITRVADVTGLDDLGIPVTMAVRPLARTLSVAQGKGATLDSARVSGAMEAIEAWHGERAVPAPCIRAPARQLELPYPVTELESHPGSFFTDRTVMDWINARSTLDGEPVPVPAAAIQLGREVHDTWRLYLPSASTNGLASGNTRWEAITHGLCELIERDVISALTAATAHRIAPDSVDDLHCAGLIERLTRSRCWFELWHLPNRYRVPVMACYLWREDQPTVVVSGSGAHLDPGVTLSRAITEVAQTRLTQITGSREDIHPTVYRHGPNRPPTDASAAPVSWPEITSSYTASFPTDDTEARHLAATVASCTGFAPLVVDLTSGDYTRTEFAVVKVLAPTLRYVTRHTVPRPRTEAIA
ncbi:hypothetical protein CTZ27_25020 [Streptomyces griseocarneus]|nr:hypothetical protein CTZ27_25020 [Streptomyces griseocarneus]